MINPFRTRKILHIHPRYEVLYEIPFIGKIRTIVKRYILDHGCDLRGRKFDLVIIDENIRLTKEQLEEVYDQLEEE